MWIDDLVLYRKWYSDKSTIGELTYKSEFFCYVLEDKVRAVGKKIYGETAIPMGTYKLTVDPSPRFKTRLPRLHDVPGFKGILIHAGNTAADSHGCLLLGRKKGKNRIMQSRLAMNDFMSLLEDNVINDIRIIDTKATS